ncbi:N-acetylmuramoyl-L-alanine amidase [Candidatus Woesearchaeota archaeon]|nr:N-acetylmuramoyl-L-alanine amidase [Candidatus Woesearchaeota archaeon]
MEKNQVTKLFDIAKLATILYVVNPFSCLSENSQDARHDDPRVTGRYSAVYGSTNATQKNDSKEKPLLYDLKEKPKVIVFSGHELNNGGATSITGVNEYEYNDCIVAQFRELESPLEYITHLATENIDLKKRPELAEQSDAQVYIEIHHDSVNKKDLDNAKTAGKDGQQVYGGFSLHISSKWFYEETRSIAIGMKDCFIETGLRQNTYHAQEDTGRMQEIDEGVYERSGLYILNTAKIPTLLVEAGSIVVPEEEVFMRKRETQETIVQCIDATLIRYFEKK